MGSFQEVVARRAGYSLLLLALAGTASLPAAVVGSVAGFVHDDHGQPQMGATVILFNADGRSLRRVYTNDRGGFLIEDLFPGFYGVRVSVPAFLPAMKNKILIRSGARSYLDVELASLLTSIRLVYPSTGDWTDMSEDWKWALRTASSTRPVLRMQPWDDKETESVLRKFSGAFSDVQGMVALSAGDGGQISALGSESDMGTAFAVATSLFGNSNLLVSGNLGYGSTRGAPSAGFHTSYSREMPYGSEPEVSVTVRQLLRPVEAGQALFGGGDRYAAALQTFSFGFQDHVTLGDLAKLEYGFQYDSISFLDRLNYVSPFAKLTYNLNPNTAVILRYAGGVPRPDAEGIDQDDLGRNLSALGLYPRMSLRDGRPTIQRGQHMEIAIRTQQGDNTVELAAYRDGFSNAAVTALLPGGIFTDGNVLPDLFSNASTLNAGSYSVAGYRASYSHKWSDHVSTGVVYGLSGVLVPESGTLATDNVAELRALLKPVREHSLTAQMVAQAPRSGTRLRASYQWASQAAVTPADLYNISDTWAMPGMNLTVRQPLPQVSYLPGRFEATAEFRNLLAQGYVPIRTADGRRMFLVQSARSFRGGFNFVF